MTSDTDLRLEPSLFGIVRDNWLMIGGFVVALTVASVMFGSTRTVEWRSTASVIVEDPKSAVLFESASGVRPERYVETQAGIMNSPAVAEKASELLAAGAPPIEMSPEDVLAGSTVSFQDSSDLISVTFVADSRDAAEAAADAMINGYLELRRSEAIAGFSAALAQLDDSIVQNEQDLEALNQRIESLRSDTIVSLELQYEDALENLIAIQQSPDATQEDILAVIEQLRAFETVSRIESSRPELASLLEEQSLVLGRLSSLTERRSEVAVDAELAGGGFVFVTQAMPASRTNPSPRLFALVGAVLGGMIGVGFAYTSATWRRRVSSTEDPELLIHAPLLGAIPDFDVAIDTPLPVANALQSNSAEAYRFVMAAVESQLSRPEANLLGTPDRLVFITSTAPEDGRTTLVANMAIAAARSGKRVLVLDCDFDTQGLTRLLMPGLPEPSGITEIVIGTNSLESVIKLVPIGTGAELHLISRGSDIIGAQDLFGSQEAGELLNTVREQYDLVLVDSPPLPHVGYATTLARLADRVLVVVRHRTPASQLEELQRRLALVGSRVIGYVYNRASSLSDFRRTGRHMPEEGMAGPPDEVETPLVLERSGDS